MATDITRTPVTGPGLPAGLASPRGPASAKVRALHGRAAVAAARPVDRHEPAGRAAPGGGGAPLPIAVSGPSATGPPRARAAAGVRELDRSAVRSVDRAAALLLALGEFPAEAGVSELARRLGLHKSTASRLLATLQYRGLVEQDEETGKYRLGLVVIRLAERAEKTLDLRSIALPELERLARQTKETVSLCVREGDGCLTVAQVDGPNMVACADWTGRSTPLHGVAAGKVLLAAMAEREVLRLARGGLAHLTERTITELPVLLEELARVRRRGFATGFSEWEAGVNAVAAPVSGARGQVVAAVDVWGPSYRITPQRVGGLAALAREAAAAVSVRLGGTPG